MNEIEESWWDKTIKEVEKKIQEDYIKHEEMLDRIYIEHIEEMNSGKTIYFDGFIKKIINE